MTAFIIVINIVTTIIVMRCIYNMLVTHYFNKMMGTLSKFNIEYYGKGKSEEQAVLNKIREFGFASFPAVMLGIIWPIGVLFLIGWVIYKAGLKSNLPQFMMAKPYRELSVKKALELEKTEFQEALKVLEASGMDVSKWRKL